MGEDKGIMMPSAREPLCKIPRQYWGSQNQRNLLELDLRQYDLDNDLHGLLDRLLHHLSVGNCNDFQFTRIMAQIRGYPVA